MITRNAAEATQPLSERVIEQHVNLAPVPGSPLALLVDASLNPEVACMSCYEEGLNVEVINDFTHLATSGNFDGEKTIHCQEMQSITELVANSVRITMDTARNKVNPIVTAIIKEIEREFKENVYNPGINVELAFTDEIPLMKNDSFLSMVANNRSSGNLREVPSLNCFASITRAALPEFLKTNVDSVDTEIAAWFNTFGSDRLANAFGLVFERNGDRGYNIYDWIRDDLDMAIAVYLLARHFITNDNAIDHVSDISLPKLNAGLTIVLASSATVIHGLKERYATTKKRDVMVHSYPGRNASITNMDKNVEIQRVYVHKDKFDEFIAKGGTVDMIYGNILETQRMYTVDDVIANGRATTRRWENHCLSIRNKADSRKFEVFKRAILSTISTWVRDNDDYMLSLDSIMSEARGLVGQIKYGDMVNGYDVVLGIVDKLLFANSDAVTFLRIMNKYAIDQPELDMRHIATLAAYEYTAAWVSSMIIAEK